MATFEKPQTPKRGLPRVQNVCVQPVNHKGGVICDIMRGVGRGGGECEDERGHRCVFIAGI